MTRSKKQKFKTKKLSSEQLKQRIIKQFIKRPKKRYNAKLLSIKTRASNSTDSIQHVLNVLEDEGKIFQLEGNKYRLDRFYNEKMETQPSNKKVKGRVDMTRSGAAFILVDEMEGDVYVPSKFTNGAMHGDIVEVALVVKPWKKRTEGKIKKVIKRALQQVIGTFKDFGKYGVVESGMKRINVEVHIHPDHYNGATSGQKVVAHITEYGQGQNKPIWGKVVEAYEGISHNDYTMNSILLENGFTVDFPEIVMKEAALIPDTLSDQEILRRRDMRDTWTITIDPDTAKDFDDAISYKVLEGGNIELGVHIADVTHYLKQGSEIDKEAFDRSTSVYLVDRVAPMLPEKLSNHLCSLVPHQDRLSFSALFTLDEKFKIIKEWFGRTVIHSDRRFTYEEAQDIIEGKSEEHSQEILKLKEIAEHFRKAKFKNGAINFESPEVKFELDENAVPISLYVKERKDAHMLIEDFMLLANRRVAHFIDAKSSQEIPFVYRVHDEPNQDKLAAFKGFAKEFGIELKLDTPSNIAKSFNEISKKAQTDETLKLLMPMAIRTMAKAIYTTDNIGHYGLSFTHYAHFTSPIRRYADVLVHRILFQNLDKINRWDKETLEAQCKHISAKEKNASDAERDSIKYKQVEFMSDKIGEVFDGMVSGIIDRGIFIELIESKAEGLIGFDRFEEVYETVNERLKVRGVKTGRTIKVGDKMRVRVLETDLDARQIELEIIDEKESE